jgi:hypothetical protein
MLIKEVTYYFSLIETNIKEFMTFYRTTFPQASVLPKMHMLEAHVILWLRSYGVGLGLMSREYTCSH